MNSKSLFIFLCVFMQLSAKHFIYARVRTRVPAAHIQINALHITVFARSKGVLILVMVLSADAGICATLYKIYANCNLACNRAKLIPKWASLNSFPTIFSVTYMFKRSIAFGNGNPLNIFQCNRYNTHMSEGSI